MSDAFPPWVWVSLIIIHEASGTAKIYWDNLLKAQGAVALPAKVYRSTHMFGGSIDMRPAALFRGVLRDVYVTGAAIDDHHRGHLLTHTGPPPDWEAAWQSKVEAERCGAAGCVCTATGAAGGGRRLGSAIAETEGAAAERAATLERIPYGHRLRRPTSPPEQLETLSIAAGAEARAGGGSRRLQGVPQATPDAPTGFISNLEGGNSTSTLGVRGGSEVFISGQFGEVAYPDSQAPMVFIGTTPCEVDLLESTSRLVKCATGALTAADLEGKSGLFTLPLVVYTPLALETNTGQVVPTANPATCSISNVSGGCTVRFDLDSQPAVSSLPTTVMAPGGVLRMAGGGLKDTKPPPPPPDLCEDTCHYASDGYCDDGGEGSEFGSGFRSCALGTDCVDCGARPDTSSGSSRRRLTAASEAEAPEVENDGESLDIASTLEVHLQPTAANGQPTAQCAMRNYNRGDGASSSQDDGSRLGPSSDSEASCQVSAGINERGTAGFYSVAVRQTQDNRGYAQLNDADANVDLVSGRRYHFEVSARISSISPALAPVHGGIPVTVRGTGFGTDPLAIDARLGGAPCPIVSTMVGGFICNLADGQDQFASVDDWEWQSERGARWQWYYQSSLHLDTLSLDAAMAHASFPDGADGEMLTPTAQVVRRWNDNFISRLSGWFVAPSTVEYAFFVRADDTAFFYLNTEGTEAVRPASPLVSLTAPVLQWPADPQSERVALVGGRRYWFELLCARSSEYTGYGSPEEDLAAATGGQDGYRMGRCDFGARVHAPAESLPGGQVKGAAFEIHEIVLMSSLVGFTELGLEGCSQWVTINQTSYGNAPPTGDDVEAAVRRLLPAAPTVVVERARLSDDAYKYTVTIRSAGTQGLLRARSYGVEWSAVRAKIGGIDVLPMTGDMLIAPALRRRPTVTVRLGNQTNAACGTADWDARRIGCYLRFQPRFTTDYSNPDEILSMNETVVSVGGMTLERCSVHCERLGYPYLAVSKLSGITQVRSLLIASDRF